MTPDSASCLSEAAQSSFSSLLRHSRGENYVMLKIMASTSKNARKHRRNPSCVVFELLAK